LAASSFETDSNISSKPLEKCLHKGLPICQLHPFHQSHQQRETTLKALTICSDGIKTQLNDN